MGGGSRIAHQHHNVVAGPPPADPASTTQREPASDDDHSLRLVRATAAGAQGQADRTESEINPSPAPSVQRRATTAVLAALSDGHAASVAQALAGAGRPTGDGASYLDDPAAFQAAYDAARERAENGEQVVPLILDDATGGLGAREGGRAFGIELEFDIPGLDHDSYDEDEDDTDERYQTLAAIADDLHRAGLARASYVYDYHESRGRHGDRYDDQPDSWRIETDETVTGEVVSPILYDTPETWHAVGEACRIIRSHGGTASIRAGGHVHVGAGNYDHQPDNHTRLVRLVSSYEDTLFRLATNPERGWHRGTSWCYPNTHPSAAYQSIDSARRDNVHDNALNLYSMSGGPDDHVEFRMWDASLDAAIVQTQVKLSLGLTEAAFRGAGGHTDRARIDPLGSHHRGFVAGRGHGARLTGQQWRASTSSFRALVDTVFHRSQDKAQATALFSTTRWSEC